MGLDLRRSDDHESVYHSSYQSDLAVLSDSKEENDLFTKLLTIFVGGPLLGCFNWFWKFVAVSFVHHTLQYQLVNEGAHSRYLLTIHFQKPLPIDPEHPAVGDNRSLLHKYNDKHIKLVQDVIGTVFSCVAPLVSIVVLSFVTEPHVRLGLVCAFTLLFCLCLAIATESRRIEIFAATAAYVFPYCFTTAR